MTALDDSFALLVEAAVAGRRCPSNDHVLLNKNQAAQLAAEGRLRILISGHNWRQVEILIGPHAGAKTAPNPSGAQAWKVIDAKGCYKPTPDGPKPYIPDTPKGRRPEPWRPGQPRSKD